MQAYPNLRYRAQETWPISGAIRQLFLDFKKMDRTKPFSCDRSLISGLSDRFYGPGPDCPFSIYHRMAPEPFDAMGVVPSTTWLFWSILSFERHANELRIRPLSSRSSLQVLERQLRHVFSMEKNQPRGDGTLRKLPILPRAVLAIDLSAKDKKAGAGRQFFTNARCTNAIEYCGKVLTQNRQWRWLHTGYDWYANMTVVRWRWNILQWLGIYSFLRKVYKNCFFLYDNMHRGEEQIEVK